eukprot:comp18827_c0_seq1/m.20818 comp18827_c0_seq1/g.20818  ORF comp18827_c0_seq1/g.20818 comp18827_c0_seq1/m.20818 type:complete len:357 (-) comp18827_c0_seq1:733-1803(-)
MNFFKSKSKSPAELCKLTKEAIITLEKEPNNKKACEKALEEISKYLQQMKIILYGDGETEPNKELVAQLAQEVYNSDLLLLLINNLAKFEFEAKKDAAQIFNNLLRRQIGTRFPTVEYICKREAILFTLVNGYESDQNDIALNCGLIMRECIKHEALAKILLYSNLFYKFFDYVDLSTFDVASDAFATFKDLITKHKSVCAEFMEANYDKFFQHYEKLLDSNNYVTRRQSLKLLGELLLDRANFNIMTRYISDPENLKRMMNLLRSKSRNIQFEAFHVFKVFVANPNKPDAILNILLKNRAKLIDFLGKFHNDRTEDEQFNDEKAYIIKQINNLQPSAPKAQDPPQQDDHEDDEDQ